MADDCYSGLTATVAAEHDEQHAREAKVKMATRRENTRRSLLPMIVLVTVLSIGHHVDHIIRGNHIGWPLSAEVTPFTYSFGFYPVILVGFILTVAGRTGPGFWAVLTAVGFFFVGLTHLGPMAVEPPRDIIDAYGSAVAGWLAFDWLLLFPLGLASLSIFAVVMRRRS